MQDDYTRQKEAEMERAERLYRESTPLRRKSPIHDPGAVAYEESRRVSDIVEALRSCTQAFAALHESLGQIHRRIEGLEIEIQRIKERVRMV